MKREFLLNIMLLIVLNLLIKPFYIFGIDRTVQNTLGPEIYGGSFAVLLNFVYLFQIINDFGIQNFTSQNISKHPKVLAKYFPQFISLKLIMGGIFMLLVIIGAYFMGYEVDLWPIIALLGLNQVLVSFIFYFRANLAGLGFYRLDSIISVSDKLFLILICSVLLWGVNDYISFSVYHFVIAQTASLLLTFFISLRYVVPHLTGFRLAWSKTTVLAILRQSFPYALVLFLSLIYTRVDSVMIKHLLVDGDYESGAYASAFKLLETSNMFAYLFGALLLPMFSKMIINKERIQDLFEISTKLIWLMSITVTTILVLYRNEIMDLLYVHSTEYWASIMGVLMLGYIAGALSFIFGALLLAQGCLKQINFLYLASAIVNIGLNLYLIPEYKALGAAYTTLFTQGVVAIGTFIIILRYVNISISYRYYLSMIGFLVGACLIAWSWNKWNHVCEFNMLIQMILLGLLFLILGWFMHLIPRNLQVFISNRQTSK